MASCPLQSFFTDFVVLPASCKCFNNHAQRCDDRPYHQQISCCLPERDPARPKHLLKARTAPETPRAADVRATYVTRQYLRTPNSQSAVFVRPPAFQICPGSSTRHVTHDDDDGDVRATAEGRSMWNSRNTSSAAAQNVAACSYRRRIYYPQL